MHVLILLLYGFCLKLSESSSYSKQLWYVTHLVLFLGYPGLCILKTLFEGGSLSHRRTSYFLPELPKV